MSWQQSIQAAVRSLKQEEQTLQKQLDTIQAKISELEDISSGGRASAGARKKATRRLSRAGRDAISKAAKKRWAKYRQQKRQSQRA